MNNLNKLISVWRGDQTPPTDYHLWVKDGAIFVKVDNEWVSTTYLTELYAPSTELDLNPKPKDTIDESIGKLHKAILDNELIFSKIISKLQEVIGLDNTLSFKPSDKNLQNLDIKTILDKLMSEKDIIEQVIESINTITSWYEE